MNSSPLVLPTGTGIGLLYCNAMTGIIMQHAFGVLVLSTKSYEDFSLVMHKYQVELCSRLM